MRRAFHAPGAPDVKVPGMKLTGLLHRSRPELPGLAGTARVDKRGYPAALTTFAWRP